MNTLKKESRDRQSEQTQENIQKLSDILINLYEQNSKKFEGVDDQVAVEFTNLILEQYSINKEKTNQIKFYQLIDKFLKNEVKDIGIKIYKLLGNIINVHQYERIGEMNIRAFTALLIFVNENSPRIIEIMNYNLNNYRPSKILAKNSIELLGFFSNLVLYSFQNYNKYLNEHNPQGIDYLLELKKQNEKIVENISIVIKSVKKIEKDNNINNYKDCILEKYWRVLILHLYLLYFIKNKNLKKEEIEFICQTFHLILKRSGNYNIYQSGIKYFEGILCLGQTRDNSDINQFNNEVIKNWKIYLNEENYFENRCKSDNKYNLILKFILKYFLYWFGRAGNNNEPVSCFKDLYKNIIDDKYILFKRLISKINDFKIVPLELKGQQMYLIYLLYSNNLNGKIPPSFDNLYFFLKEITSLYQTLYSLSNDYISSLLKDEKQQQKELSQKNMIKINLEDDKNTIQKNNLNHLFLMLLSNKYDKFIYIEDSKLLFEFMKNSLNIFKSFIELFYTILENKENKDNLENRTYLINRMAVQLSKFFYFFYYVYERNRINSQRYENESDLIDKLIEIYIDFKQDLLIAVFKRLMPYILKLYKLGNKISQIKNLISNKLIHNIFKVIKDTTKREILFRIYLEFFSMKIYETGNPPELFNSDYNNLLYNSPTVLNVQGFRSSTQLMTNSWTRWAWEP